jgi:hypothetical protein
MRVLVATITSVLLVGVAATAASAAPARSTTLTAAEQKWATPVINVWNVMNTSLGKVVSQATAGKGAGLIAGTKQNRALVVTLANFVDCGTAMTKAKAPPTDRLKPFAATMKRACAQLKAGALDFANGISSIGKGQTKVGTLQIQKAYGELQKGSKTLGTARAQLLTIGGKGFKG